MLYDIKLCFHERSLSHIIPLKPHKHHSSLWNHTCIRVTRKYAAYPIWSYDMWKVLLFFALLLVCCPCVWDLSIHFVQGFFLVTGESYGCRSANVAMLTQFMRPTWGPSGPCRLQMDPCWPHEPCYQGKDVNEINRYITTTKSKEETRTAYIIPRIYLIYVLHDTSGAKLLKSTSP